MSERTSVTIYDDELAVMKQAKRNLEHQTNRDLSLHVALAEFAARDLNGKTCADCGDVLDDGGFWVAEPGDEPPAGYDRGARLCHDCAGIPHREDIEIDGS